MAKILIVDDSLLSRRISRQILEGAGHQVVEAKDGIAAIEQYFLEKPLAVLLDITMAGMNGIEVLEKIRELDPAARIIIATADVQKSTRVMTELGGACGFVTKPLEAEKVLQALDHCLAGAV